MARIRVVAEEIQRTNELRPRIQMCFVIPRSLYKKLGSSTCTPAACLPLRALFLIVEEKKPHILDTCNLVKMVLMTKNIYSFLVTIKMLVEELGTSSIRLESEDRSNSVDPVASS